MSTFRDLKIWQKSMDLVTDIYQKTEGFPDSEKYGLVSQIRRSAISIPSNIAEGYGRNSNGEFQRYLNISMGSLFELQTQIEIAQNLEYFNDNEGGKMYELSREIERMLSSFIRSIE
ncbi:four helix bundle protein [Fodinibius sp. Rm-B-1B1-1]|uniref:four helix bundle protein n=1 Tax=Fodinibius alkaliphilus TaxID=3140241 RepID=UPI00315AFFD5